MTVAHEKNAPADLSQVAEAGIHLPEPTDAHEEHDDPDHEHGFEIVERFLRVVFVALAAAAVWFHLWEKSASPDVDELAKSDY